MKTLKITLFGGALALLLVSCQPASTKFLNEFTRFVEQVEQKHSTYSENDEWDSIDQQLQSYMSRYKELNAQQAFTDEEEKQVGELVGRYYKARFSDWGLFKIVPWISQKWGYFTGILEGFGIHVDVCGFFRDIIGIDICSYLSFGSTGSSVGIDESTVNESLLDE